MAPTSTFCRFHKRSLLPYTLWNIRYRYLWLLEFTEADSCHRQGKRIDERTRRENCFSCFICSRRKDRWRFLVMSFLCCYYGNIQANGNMPEGQIDSDSRQ